MTHDDSKHTIPRRRVLAGLGAVGLASAGAGLGTSAFFSDTESFDDNLLVAGELDLKVDWQVAYFGPNGFEYLGAYPDNYLNDPNDPSTLQQDSLGNPISGSDGIQDPILTRSELEANGVADVEAAYRSQFANVPDDLGRPVINLIDVKPGDWGEVTFSFHLFDNPGYIWLNGGLLANAENSVMEPELRDGDENNLTPVPEGTVDDQGELAREIVATIWYDDGDNVLQEDETVIVRGPLDEVLEILSTDLGIPLDANESTDGTELDPVGDGSGTLEGPTFVDGNPSCADLGLLSAIKIEDVVEGTYQTPVGEIALSNAITKDAGTEIKTIDWSSTFPVQAVIVKGASGANVYDEQDDPPVGSMSGTADAPEEFGISHLSFCYDAEPGSGDGGRECYPNSTTRYIGFTWELPVDHANEIQTDSVSFDLGFYTEQCRHNDGLGMSSET